MQTHNENSHNQRMREYRERLNSRGIKRIEVAVPEKDAPLLHNLAGILRDGGDEAKLLRQKILQATGDDRQNTGKDLIAFFHNSPLAGIAIEFERDQSASRTIDFDNQ